MCNLSCIKHNAVPHTHIHTHMHETMLRPWPPLSPLFSARRWWRGRPPDPGTDLDEGAVPHSSLHCHIGDDGGIGDGALQPHAAGVHTAAALRQAGSTAHETGWASRFFTLCPLPSIPPLALSHPWLTPGSLTSSLQLSHMSLPPILIHVRHILWAKYIQMPGTRIT